MDPEAGLAQQLWKARIEHQQFQQNCGPAASLGQDTARGVDNEDLEAEEAFAGPGSGAALCPCSVCRVIPDPEGHQQEKLSFAAHGLISSEKTD